MAYDMIPFFEKVVHDNPDELDTPDSFFMFPTEIIVFDHKEKTVDIIVYSTQGNKDRLHYLQKIIKMCTGNIQNPNLQEKNRHLNFESNFMEKDFHRIVEQAKVLLVTVFRLLRVLVRSNLGPLQRRRQFHRLPRLPPIGSYPSLCRS